MARQQVVLQFTAKIMHATLTAHRTSSSIRRDVLATTVLPFHSPCNTVVPGSGTKSASVLLVVVNNITLVSVALLSCTMGMLAGT